MSKRLKLCSGAEAVQKFKKAGWSAVRQKGSHVMLTKPGPGLLRKLIRQADLTIEEFNEL